MNSNRKAVRRRVSARRAAAHHIELGHAVCRIAPCEKRPTYPRWASRCVAPEAVEPGDGIGIVCGPISGAAGQALVCVDLDAPRAVRLADKHLPATGMVDGRPGKPRSHRWYSVSLASVGADHKSRAAQTAPVMLREYGHPGPRTVSFRDACGHELVRVIGTGGQAVVPPSRHSSGERRVWDGGRPGEPAVVSYRGLLGAVRGLARKCGWAPKPERAAVGGEAAGAGAADSEVGAFLAYRINRYLDALPPSISGEGGHDACFHAACVLVWGFALGEADAVRFLRRFNARCRPPWSAGELLHKVRDAAAATDHTKARGHLI